MSKSKYSGWWTEPSFKRRSRRGRKKMLVGIVVTAGVLTLGTITFSSFKSRMLDMEEPVESVDRISSFELPSPETVSISIESNNLQKLPEPIEAVRSISAKPQETVLTTTKLPSIEKIEAPSERMASLRSDVGSYMAESPFIDSEPIDRAQPTIRKEVKLELPEIKWNDVVVKPNDNLSLIFVRNELTGATAVKVSKMPGAKMTQSLRIGDLLRFARSNEDEILGIEFVRSPGKKQEKRVILLPVGDSFEVVDNEEVQRVGNLDKLLKERIEIEFKEDTSTELALQEFEADENVVWHDVKVRKGDTLGRIFSRLDLPSGEAIEVANAPKHNSLRAGLKPGQKLRIATTTEGQFAALEIDDLAAAKTRIVLRRNDEYIVGYRNLDTDTREDVACTIIRYNLYEAAKAVKIPKSVVEKFASIFESRIDFSRQLKKGDEYCVVYQQKHVENIPVGSPTVLAASLRQVDNLIQAFRFDHEQSGRSSSLYYDQYGFSMEGYFLRSPIKYARVTSVFSNNRFHPILKKYRPHRGVDYGAKTGTPIRATADGTVVSRRNENGYGKVIVLQHGSTYSTLYAHMSKFGKNTSEGSHVKQGQVIGYVGSTGVSTGPHLHYEFRVNGVHKDPLTHDLPSGKPISDNLRTKFNEQIAVYGEKLARARDLAVALGPTITVQ